MNDFWQVVILILSFAAYGYLHSVFASLKLKKFLKKHIGSKIAFYRLTYNFFAIAGLYIIWDFAPHPSLKIYELSYPYDLLIYGLQLLSLAGIFWTFRYISFKEFTGIAQINRYIDGEYNDADLDEKMTFRTGGPYKFSRHPIYLFSILFLLFRPEMNLFYLTMFISFVLYFYIGSVFEEKKLEEYFGSEYSDYKKKVSRIFPVKYILNKAGK